MIQIDKEREKIKRAQEIVRTTDSRALKRDLEKYVRRAEKEIRQALLFMKEAKACRGGSTRTASRT